MKIAFIGKICSGKSTLAQYLKDNHNYDILSFGEPVKRYAKDIFGLDNKNRIIIQDFAQKVKEIDFDVWVKYLIRNFKNISNTNIVIDDLRFPNEYKALKNENFVFIKLDIDKELQVKRIKKIYRDSWETHIQRLDNISESYIDKLDADFTIKIENDTFSIEPILNEIFNHIKNN
tara:strand:+ start:52 stop:576 length:525 start_codon:yes stop_codon:yes gene_type:complete